VLTTLLRPRALVSHLLVLTVAVTCVSLGLWQLDRLDQVRANNDRLADRLDDDPVDLTELMAAEVDPDALEFRPVTVSGVYRHDDEVLQRGQSHQQQQGFHVLTPLEVGDDEVVLVRRGWVPSDLSEPPVDEAAPPGGEVTLTGILEKPVEQPGFGPRDPDEGTLARVFHADTERLDRQIDGELFEMVLRLDAPDDAAFDDLPVGLATPELDEANHLSYALQWFSFALLALITYAAWLWKRHRREQRDVGAPAPEDAAPREPAAPPR
jgi:surfeit locus 1 family protein